jgi:hypothetical protein
MEKKEEHSAIDTNLQADQQVSSMFYGLTERTQLQLYIPFLGLL